MSRRGVWRQWRAGGGRGEVTLKGPLTPCTDWRVIPRPRSLAASRQPTKLSRTFQWRSSFYFFDPHEIFQNMSRHTRTKRLFGEKWSRWQTVGVKYNGGKCFFIEFSINYLDSRSWLLTWRKLTWRLQRTHDSHDVPAGYFITYCGPEASYHTPSGSALIGRRAGYSVRDA